MQAASVKHARFAGDLLTIGFAATVAMWGAAFFAHLPGHLADATRDALPHWLLLLIVAMIMLVAGFFASRLTARGWTGGLYAGLVTGTLNLLILGGILSSHASERFLLAALAWAPLSVVVAMACGTIGAVAARGPAHPAQPLEINWPAAFTLVAAGATLLLILVGGMVTGFEAGLDVPDWPNSFGYNMFLYPIVDMPGGVFFEHSHRLLGSLSGLTAVVLAVYLWRTDSRRWLRWLAVVVVLMVVAQGIMGGLRVTGRFTFSTARTDMAPSILLAMIHAVFGQVFFATLVATATTLSTRWMARTPPVARQSASVDRRLGIVVVAILLIQLITGATLRHIAGGVHLHVSLAVIALALVAVFAVRSWGVYEKEPVLPKLGLLVVAVAGVQLALGIAALVVIMFEAQGQSSPTVQALITTLHQTAGALLLAGTTSLLLWHYRPLASHSKSSAAELTPPAAGRDHSEASAP
jgi:cytochrome c oxidase assembly protein subunit 15